MLPKRVAALALALTLTGCKSKSGGDEADAEAETKAESQADPSDAVPPPIPELREFPLPAGPGSYAPNVMVSGEMLYLAWYERHAGDEVALRFARHDGKAWSEAETLVSSVQIGFDARLAPTVGAMRELTVYVGWPQRDASGKTAWRLSRSRGAGRRWGPPETVFETTEIAPSPPVPVASGTSAATLSWLEHDDEDGTSIRQTTVPEQGSYADATKRSRELQGLVCSCCVLAATDSGSGQVLAWRSPDGARLFVGTDAGRHEVADVSPEPECHERYTSLDVLDSTLVVAWTDEAKPSAACLAFTQSPKTWPPCMPLGEPEQHATGDVVLLDPDSALLTLSGSVDDGEARRLTARAIRRDGVLGQERTIATVPPCPADACGHTRATKFGDRLVWIWVDPGAQGQSRIRAAIAPLEATR